MKRTILMTIATTISANAITLGASAQSRTSSVIQATQESREQLKQELNDKIVAAERAIFELAEELEVAVADQDQNGTLNGEQQFFVNATKVSLAAVAVGFLYTSLHTRDLTSKQAKIGATATLLAHVAAMSGIMGLILVKSDVEKLKTEIRETAEELKSLRQQLILADVQ